MNKKLLRNQEVEGLRYSHSVKLLYKMAQTKSRRKRAISDVGVAEKTELPITTESSKSDTW